MILISIFIQASSNGSGEIADIYWHSSSFHEGNTNQAFSSGRVNKFPGKPNVFKKNHT